MIDATFRFPLFVEKHHSFRWIIFQNSVIGLNFQAGDAWGEKIDGVIQDFSLKKSVGLQWRINGFSFYNYPTAIEFEYHQPLNKFEDKINGKSISYGEKGRSYLKYYLIFNILLVLGSPRIIEMI